MRVLIISQYFWPENFGINALASALREKGVHVAVLTAQPNYPDGVVFPGYRAWQVRRESYDGIEVLRLPLFPRGKHSPWRLALNYLSFVLSGYLVAPWLVRGERYDAIFVYAPSPLLQALPAIALAGLKRAPLFLWVQDLWPESVSATGYIRNRAALRMIDPIVNFIYRRSDRILVPSEAFRGPIERRIDDPARIAYFPNAWSDGAGAPPEPSVEVQSLVDQIRQGFSVVFAGNLGKAQSLEMVLDAAEALQRDGEVARFFLIGSGSLSDWLAAEVARRGLQNVVMPGRFPPDAMGAIYAAAGALLVSLRDEPIFAYTIPSKVQGYLAAGRPIIASLNGEGARVVRAAEAGLTCPAGDAPALVAAVKELSRMNPETLARFGENARRYAVDRFSLDRLADQLIEELRGVPANNQRTAT